MDLGDYVCGLSFKYNAWDELILLTPQKSDDGVVMKALQRSREDRMQEQLQLVEKKSREDRMQEQLQLVEKKLNEARMQLVEMKKSDWMNLSTTLWSVYGGWMEDYLRSKVARILKQLQLVEKKLNDAIIQLVEINDWMNLSTTQKSDDGGWMKDYLRLNVARMQKQLQLVEMELNVARMQKQLQLVEMELNDAIIQLVEIKKSDWWKLSTTQKSDDGGWMKDYLSPELQRPDRSKVKAPRERNRSSLVRIKHQSMEGIVTFQGEPSSPWDVMNLPTALQAVVGGGM